jgi:hypothetical protein
MVLAGKQNGSEAVALFRAGKSKSQIAAELGIGRASVLRAIRTAA